MKFYKKAIFKRYELENEEKNQKPDVRDKTGFLGFPSFNM